MPLFPAVKFMDTVIGVDMHAVAPIPGIPIHPYVGPVYLWSTPVFPSINVFINGMPACSVGALGYFFHVPQGVPVPPTPTNQSYWKRYLVNIPMVLTLTGLTMLANLAIAGIASLIPKPKSVESFIKDVTGVDTSSRAATWQSIQSMFAQYSQWQTWVKLLMPPLPYPGAQGSVAVGSPNVTVNGGALAFVGPLLGTSCSDIPVVPNAVTLGFSNVLVGISFADLARAIAVATAQRAVQAAVQKGVEAATPEEEPPAEEQNNECEDGGHPVSQATGAAWSRFTDVNWRDFVLRRTVRSTWCDEDGPFGFGMRHSYQCSLTLGATQAMLIDSENRRFYFKRREDGRYDGTAFGWTLNEVAVGRFVVRHGGMGALGFERLAADAPGTKLTGWARDRVRESFTYDAAGRLVGNRIRPLESASGTAGTSITFIYDDAGHVSTITGGEVGTAPVTLGSYRYDAAGCLVFFRDAMGGDWHYAYDPARRCVRETDPNGYSFHYEYDTVGRCIRSTGDDGLWRVALQFTPGRTLMTEADNGLWVYAINEHRTITEVMDPYGGKRQRQPGPDGRVLLEVDSGGRTMHNLFDPSGRQIGRLDRWGNRWPTQDEAPKLPNPLAHRLPPNAQAREWGTARGAAGLVVGQLRAELRAALDATIPAAPRVAPVERYDLLGRVVERTDATGANERYQYDRVGNLIAITDADGLTQTQTFGSWNLRMACTNAADETIHYRFTKREKLAAITDAGGAVSKYVYDCKDRLTHVTRHGLLREIYRYDAGDRLVEKLDGEGDTLLAMQIGGNGLPIERALASGETHKFAYDAMGNITEASTSKASVKLRYAGRRRLADLRDGRGIVHEWVGGEHVSTTYFDRFKIRREKLATGDTLIHFPVGRPHRITVDAHGDVLKALGNGTHELSRYDAAGRCVGRARWWRGEAAPADWTSYSYSGTGELRTVRDGKTGDTVYHYDAAHRLTRRDGAQGGCAFAYDAAGNLTATPAWPSLSCIEGNRLDRGGNAAFRHDARNRLAEIAQPDGSVTRFEYDSLDLLVRVQTTPDGRLWEAEKDGLCRRIAKSVDGARTDYFWDGDRLGAELAPDGRVRLYVYPDIDALLPLGFIDYANLKAEPAEGATYFVFHDQIGMPLLIEDMAGREAWRARSVDPYGAIDVAPDARVAYDLRFPGHIFDPEIGLHDNRFRTYSPTLGRYLQSDPAGQSAGINLYAYAANPLVDVDVLGLAHNKSDPDSKENADQAGPPGENPDEPPPGGPPPEEDMPPMPSDEELAKMRQDLVEKTKARAVELAENETPGKGPVVTGVMDPRYPEDGPFFANNTKGQEPDNLTDVMQNRVDGHKEDLADGMPVRPQDETRNTTPADHSETSAADQALKNREARTGRPATEADLAEMQAHNSNCSTMDGGPTTPEQRAAGAPNRNKIPPGEGCPDRCDHCDGITGQRDTGPGMTMIGSDGQPIP